MAVTDTSTDTGLSDIRETIRFGWFIIIAVFGGLIAWSLFFPLTSAVVAPGVLEVEGNRKTVQHLEGGIIKALHAKEGDSVAAGALLIELDPTVPRASFELVDGQLIELYARHARLEAERDGAIDFAIPPQLAQRANETAVQQAFGGQLSLLHDRLAGTESRHKILDQRVAEFSEQIKGTETQAESKNRQVALLNRELTGLRRLYAKGYAPLPRILALEREAERLQGEAGAARAQNAALQNSIGETQLQLTKDKQDMQESILTELRQVEADIAKLLPQHSAAQDALRRVDIVAPVAGRVLNLAVHTAGGVVTPAMPLMEIVPGKDQLVVLAQVKPADISKVYAGRNVQVRLSAFSARTTDALEGQVLSVSPDRKTDERSGISFYQAKIALPVDLPKPFRGELKPGMPAEVFISTGRQSAIGYLMRPLTDAFGRTFRED